MSSLGYRAGVLMAVAAVVSLLTLTLGRTRPLGRKEAAAET